MVEEKILKKLETLIDKLKGLSDKFPAAQTPSKGKKGSVADVSASRMTSQEINREKTRATEAAKIYKEILGLGFDEKKITKSAKLYAKEFNIKSLIGDQLLMLNSAINTFLQSVASNENFDNELRNKPEISEGSPLDIVNSITDLRDWTHSLLTDNIEAINLLRTELLSAITDKSESTEGSPLDIVNSITDLRDWTHSLFKENTEAINLLKAALLKPSSSNKDLVKDLRRELDVLEQTRALGKLFTRSLIQIDQLKDLKAISRQILSSIKNEVGKPIQKLYEKFVDNGKAQKASLNALNNSFNSKKEITINKKSFEDLLKLMKWTDVLKFNSLQYRILSTQNTAIISRLDELIALQNEYASERNKKTGLSDLFQKMGGGGNLLAFGLGMFFVIKSIIETKSIDISSVLKSVVAVGAFVFLFNKLASAGSKLTEASKAFGIFGFIILMIIIPILKTLAKISFLDFAYSLISLYFIIETMGYLIKKIEDVSKNKNLMKTMAWFGAFTAIILFGIIPMIQTLSKIKFLDAMMALTKLSIIMAALGGILYAANKYLNNKDLKKTMTWFGGFTAIILLGLIPSMNALAKMSWGTFIESLGKLAIIFIAFGGLIYLANKALKNEDLMKMMKSFGLFALIISFVIIPTLLILEKIPFLKIMNGLMKFLIIGFTIGLLVSVISRSVKSDDLTKMVLSFGLFSLIIGFVIIPLMEKLYKMPIGTYLNGLFKLSLLMITFSFVLKLVSKQMPSPVDLLKIFLSLTAVGLLVRFVMIPMFDGINKLNEKPYLKSTLMFMLVIGVLLGGLILVAKAPLMEILKGMLVLVALSFTIGYLADNLMKLAGLKWGAIMNGLAVASVAILLFGAFVAGIGFLVTFVAPFLAIGAVTILALSFVIGILSDSFMKFTKVNWKKAETSMIAAAAAVKALVGLVLTLGVMFTLFLPFMLVGVLAIKSIGYILDVLSIQLVKFNKVDGKKLREVGFGIKELGIGLIAFVTGMIAALIGSALASLAEFFGLDVVTHIRKFEDLDSSALEAVGNSLVVLGHGLLQFINAINVGPNIFEAFFKADVTKSIKKLLDIDVPKLILVSDSLGILGDALTIFVKAYKDMQDIGSDGVKTFISTITSLEKIKQINLDGIKKAFIDVSNVFKLFDPIVQYSIALESFYNSLNELSKINLDSFLEVFQSMISSMDSFKNAYLDMDIYSIITGFNEAVQLLDTSIFNTKMFEMKNSVDTLAISLNKLTEAYKNFEGVSGESALTTISNINYDNQQLSKIIAKTHESEMIVLQNQLDQLRINGDILQQIRDGVYQIPSGGSKSPTLIPNSPPSPSQSSKTSFRTKETYLNNLKLMNMSIT